MSMSLKNIESEISDLEKQVYEGAETPVQESGNVPSWYPHLYYILPLLVVIFKHVYNPYHYYNLDDTLNLRKLVYEFLVSALVSALVLVAVQVTCLN